MSWTPPPVTDWVIDADTHVTEPPGVWVDRLPARWRDRAPRMVRTRRGVDVWRIGEDGPGIPVGVTAVAGWPDPFPSAPKTFDDVPPGASDAKARIEYMDEVGIWAMALYPNIGGFGNQAFLALEDRALMLACVQAYNDWLVEWTEPDPRRFIPIMATPFWDIDATVAEVERCVALGHKGILFTGEPQTFGQPYLGDHHWDPLYSLAAETGMSLNLHIGSGDVSGSFAPDRVRAHGVASTLITTSLELFLGNAMQVSDLLLSGVLPRHPDARFVSVESGIGWVPFVLEAADYCFTDSNLTVERPEFDMAPSEYFRRQVSVCSFFETHAPHHGLDVIGADNVLFETDYPHPVCLYGNVREWIDRAFGDLDSATRRKILWDNAARLYGVGEPDRRWEPPRSGL